VAQGSDDSNVPDSRSDERAARKPLTEEERQLRRERERQDLLAALASADFSAMRTRVAGMLNLYPEARNSDVTLTLKYWETFQPEIYKPNGILPRDLFKLERSTNIVRARAKIQNEYGLFQADEKVRGYRKGREEEIEEAVIDDVPGRSMAFVYADETGKNDKYVIVASVWVLTGRAVFDAGRAIEAWKSGSAWSHREVHFSKFGKQDMDALSEYIGVVERNREFLSFKLIAVERAKTRRSIEEVVMKLHEHMMIRGCEHEVSTRRIDLPREFELTIDEDNSLDSFHLDEMRRRVNDEYQRSLEARANLVVAQTASSRNSHLIQLADVIAGAFNRRLNHVGDRNFKDDMADLVIDRLGLILDEGDVPDLDSSALFRM
jgi:hypothetical protein